MKEIALEALKLPSLSSSDEGGGDDDITEEMLDAGHRMLTAFKANDARALVEAYCLLRDADEQRDKPVEE